MKIMPGTRENSIENLHRKRHLYIKGFPILSLKVYFHHENVILLSSFKLYK